MELKNMVNAKYPGIALAGSHPMNTMNNTLAHELQAAAAAQPGAQPHYTAAAIASAAAAAPPFRVKSENGSDRGASPHGSDAPRYQPPPGGSVPQFSTMQGYPQDMRYGSPTASALGIHGAPLMNGYQTPQDPHSYGQRPLPDPAGPQGQAGQNGNGVRMGPEGTGPPKAFACSTCGKGFARRSDLARHGTYISGTHNIDPNLAQSVSIAESVPTFAIGQVAANNLFNDLP